MSMRQFRRALRAVNGKALAYQIRDGYGSALAPLFERIARGDRVQDAEIAEGIGHDDGGKPQRVGISAGPTVIPGGKGNKSTALITARGVAMYDLEYQPYCFSTLLLAQTMKALGNDPEIGTIVIDIDSPGGVVTGTPEAADAIFAAREAKRVVALVNPLAASAAYWIASQATEIVAVPSADIGSIGVFWLHVECSKMLEAEGVKPTFVFAGEHKVKGNALEPLADDERAFQQAEIDGVYRDFLKAVARGRGVSAADVEKNFGQGRTFMAPQAKRVGMIDRIATLDVVLARYGISTAMDMRRRGLSGEAATTTEAEPRYAKADVTPGCENLRVIDEATGDDVTQDVFEVDCDAGWLVRFKRDEASELIRNADGESLATERVEGRFRLVKRPEQPKEPASLADQAQAALERLAADDAERRQAAARRRRIEILRRT